MDTGGGGGVWPMQELSQGELRRRRLVYLDRARADSEGGASASAAAAEDDIVDLT
jgi:hypothetical protein